MYPLHCYAGYGMPIRAGKYEIVAIGFKAETIATDTQLSLWDTASNTTVDEDSPPGDATRIFNIYNTGDGPDFYPLPEPLKTRKGISVGTTSNIDGGQIYIYVR